MSPANDRAEVPAEPETAPAPARRRRNWRAILTIAVGAVAALCLAGTVTGYVIYDRATEPDRSSPTVSVHQFVRAYFVDANDATAGIFLCDNPELLELRTYRDAIGAQEKRLGVDISVNVSALEQVWITDDRSEVSAELRQSGLVDGALQTIADRWSFQLVEADGWRVCGATKVS